MPFDPDVFQQVWDQIFPMIRFPLSGSLSGLTGSIEAP